VLTIKTLYKIIDLPTYTYLLINTNNGVIPPKNKRSAAVAD